MLASYIHNVHKKLFNIAKLATLISLHNHSAILLYVIAWWTGKP